MSFQYNRLNPKVLERLVEIFKKPSSQWSIKEYKEVRLSLHAMDIVADHCPHFDEKIRKIEA